MKRWLVFLCVFSIVLFVVSMIMFFFIKRSGVSVKEKADKEVQEMALKQEELKANQTIRVRLTKTSEIIAMDINEYLMGVVPAEMPPSYNMEALKAQAIVARTYTYKRIEGKAEGEDADICDNYAHCQAFYNKDKLFSIWRNKGYDDNTIKDYWSKVTSAVVQTQGIVITYQGEYIKAFFHASSPIKTESSSEIWGRENLPYLVSVESVEDPNYIYNKSEICLSISDFEKKVKDNIDSKYSTSSRSTSEVISIDSYTISGRVKDVRIGNNVVSAEKCRTIFGLRSTNFSIVNGSGSIIFKVIGNGHGLGMSQVGANYYAANGYSYEDIIKHYYKGVDITRLDK